MTDIPFFSINIPAYNAENYVLKALESVARQTFADWEVVVADDGSTDRTKEICHSQQLIPRERFTLLDCDHGGQYATRRKLLAASRGKVIVSLDSDDTLMDETALIKLHTVFSKTGCDLVMFNATRSIETKKLFVDYSTLSVDGDGRVSIESALRHLYCSYDLNNVWTKAYRRELCSFAFGDRVIHNTEDRLQCIEMFRNVRSCFLVNVPLYYYRPNEGSVTSRPYRLSYFEDFVFVESQAELLLGDLVEHREGRNEFLCMTTPRNLQRLHDSTTNFSERLTSYRYARELCLNSGVFPVQSAAVRSDCRAVYDAFIRGRYRLLDGLLGTRQRMKLIFGR